MLEAFGSALKSTKTLEFGREIDIKDYVNFDELMNQSLYELTCAMNSEDRCAICSNPFYRHELAVSHLEKGLIHRTCLKTNS